MKRVGVLGGGQLAEMLAQAAVPIGVRVLCIEKTSDTCASLVAPVEAGDLKDVNVLRKWATDNTIDVVTYESEFIDASLAEGLAEACEVRPSPVGLRASQERLREKQLFVELGIPVPQFVPADNEERLRDGIKEIGTPVVVKTRSGGYDGKGQVVVREPGDIERAVALVQGAPVIIEQYLAFDRELSIVGARGVDGETVTYPVVENEHREGILHKTLAPAPNLDPQLDKQAREYVTKLLDRTGYVGTVGFELFAVGDVIMGNEYAPRVHNSGHWTIEGAVTSQFENHVRAVAGLPLGSAEPRGFAAMVNLVGGEPNVPAILAVEGAQLHLYGKESRPGRKIGHVTVVCDTEEERDAKVVELESIIQNVLTSK